MVTVTDEERWSIALAVAQWRRNACVASEARERLRAIGLGEAEIERRRRASSSDRRTAALLRLAVTHVIARGALQPTDLLPVERLSLHAHVEPTIAAVRAALSHISAAARAGCDEAIPPIDLDIGDF